MNRSPILLVALFASAAICLQNSPALTGFGWALIHGAGAESLIAFAPAAIAFALLWTGYRVSGRSRSAAGTSLFAVMAAAILVLNEILLPVTPFRMWSGQRALAAVRVLSIRDEPLLSARGNPIGVRISFDAVVPRTGAYSIHVASLASASGETISPLGFGQSIGHRVEPAATDQRESPYDIFQKGIVYTFTQDMLPSFVRYDENTMTPCLAEVRTKYISEADFLAALAANRDIALRVEVLVNGEYNAVSVLAAEAVTSRRYDMQAIYETIAKEGSGPCKQ